jgi:hypothetical protein
LQGKEKPAKKDGLEDWQITLIYFGVAGAVAFALDVNEDQPSPFRP